MHSRFSFHPPSRKVCDGAVAFALALAAATASGAEYQFVLSGLPVANPRSEAVSPTVALAPGRFAVASTAKPLEARYRTTAESGPVGMRSDKWVGFYLIVR